MRVAEIKDQKIAEFVSRVREALGKNKPFRFFEFVSENEKICAAIRDSRSGEIGPNVTVKGRLFLAEGSRILSGTYIEGNAYIGAGCTIGPNAYLRAGVILEGNNHVANSEIKNSVVLLGSKVPHFSYVGDSILGENCNLGAGTKIANLRFDDAPVEIVVGGKKVNSGRRKLGACLGHNVKTGINSCINCGAQVKNNSKVLPGAVHR